jgi:hypothetical protein
MLHGSGIDDVAVEVHLLRVNLSVVDAIKIVECVETVALTNPGLQNAEREDRIDDDTAIDGLDVELLALLVNGESHQLPVLTSREVGAGDRRLRIVEHNVRHEDADRVEDHVQRLRTDLALRLVVVGATIVPQKHHAGFAEILKPLPSVVSSLNHFVRSNRQGHLRPQLKLNLVLLFSSLDFCWNALNRAA